MFKSLIVGCGFLFEPVLAFFFFFFFFCRLGGGRRGTALNMLTFWRGYSEKCALTLGNAQGHRDAALSPVWQLRELNDPDPGTVGSGKYLKGRLGV